MERLPERAQEKELKMNAQKLKYHQREINYAGNILTTDGHKPDCAKVAALTNFLAKFIPPLSEESES